MNPDLHAEIEDNLQKNQRARDELYKLLALATNGSSLTIDN
jgi:hypothetical protein